jgi:hypothetical protein
LILWMYLWYYYLISIITLCFLLGVVAIFMYIDYQNKKIGKYDLKTK